MPRVDCETIINRTQSDVWAYVSDPDNLRNWQADVQEVFLMGDGVARAGAEWTEVRESVLADRRVDFTWRITGWQPPQFAAFEVIEGPLSIHVEWTLSPDGDRTVMRCVVQADSRNWLKPVQSLTLAAFDRTVPRDLELLKKLLEA